MQPQDRKFQAAQMQAGSPPRVVIYSESGPTGEDLGAYLEGPFRVVVTTCQADAVDALSDPAAVLVVVPTEDPEPMIDWSILLHRAVIRGCRVMVLGPIGISLEDSYRDAVLSYPVMPDPARLHRELTALVS